MRLPQPTPPDEMTGPQLAEAPASLLDRYCGQLNGYVIGDICSSA